MDSRASHSLLELDQLEHLFERHLALPKEQRDIRKLLEGVTGPSRSMFLEELIAMDMELREQAGDSIQKSDYLIFSDDENEIVNQIFDRDASNSSQFDQILHDNRPKMPERYEQLEQIGRGGVGEVWRVFDRNVQRPLALKVLRDKYRSSRQANMRMQREAMLTGWLQHPGIPPVHDTGTLSDGSHFFAMKLVDGRTLAEIIANRESSAKSLTEDVSIFETVAQAMSFAHSQGIIHRDLKPQNIMVGQFGEVQVMDWGMARRIAESPAANKANDPPTQTDHSNARVETVSRGGDSTIESRPNLTLVGDVIGTPRYMSPEQARGELDKLDARSDVFAMGAILFEILTSTQLHGDKSTSDILERLVTENIADSYDTLKRSNSDTALADLCRRCLSREREDRPSDAGVVAAEIRNYLASIQQRAQSAELELRESDVRVQEQLKRRRVFNRMLAAIAVTISLAMAGILWQWNVVRKSNVRTAGVLDIVTKSFQSIMPVAGGTSDMTAKEVLINANKKLKESDLDPEGELILLQNLTQCFLDLGEYANAKETASEALLLCDSLLPEDHPTTLKLSHFLGQAMMRVSDLDEASELLTNTSERYRETLGPNNEESLRCELTLAGCYFRRGEINESLDRYNSIRKRFAEIFGEDSREHLVVVANLVGVYHSSNNYERAIGLGEKYLPLMKESLGTDHPEFLILTTNLATNYFALEDYEKSAKLFETTRDMMELTLGADHPNRLSVISNLSVALMSLDRSDEAILAYQEVIPLMKKKLGVDHPGVWRSQIGLGTAMKNVGRYDEAADVYKSAIASMETSLDRDNPIMALVTERYTNVLLASGQFGESAKAFTASYEEKKMNLGTDHPDTIADLNMLVWTFAVSEINGGRANKTLLDEFRNGCEITNNPDHMNTLAAAEYRWGNYEAAIEAVERAIAVKQQQSKSLANAAMSLFGSSSTDETHPSNFGLLAMCHRKLGEEEKAKLHEQKFREAIASAPAKVKNECEFFERQLALLKNANYR